VEEMSEGELGGGGMVLTDRRKTTVKEESAWREERRGFRV
jgi:hypothetical protein